MQYFYLTNSHEHHAGIPKDMKLGTISIGQCDAYTSFHENQSTGSQPNWRTVIWPYSTVNIFFLIKCGNFTNLRSLYLRYYWHTQAVENICFCMTDTTQQKPPHPYTSGWKQIPFTKHVVMSRIMIIDTAQKPSSSRMQRVFQVKVVNLNQVSMYPIFWYDGLFLRKLNLHIT